MSRKTAYTVLALFVLVAAVFVFVFLQPEKVDAPKIFSAAQGYTRGLKAQGLPIPPTVTLEELLEHKLLAPADVSGLKGANVTVSLTANVNDPQAVLIRAVFPDGHEIVTLADGTVRSNRDQNFNLDR